MTMKDTRKYKKTELGLLPEDWEVAKLGEKVSDSCYGIGAEAISYNGVDKYLRITDITDEGHFAPNPLCSPAFFSESYIAKANDLFVARTGASVGKTYLYDSKDGRLIFAGFLMKLNITDANSKFVFYYTQTSQYKNWVISESMRSGQPGLNLKQIKNLSIPLPPIEEQRRIASALTSIDNLIDSLDRLIAKKRDIKQGAMQQLLSGKKRLKGFTEPWMEKKLGDIIDIKRGVRVVREELTEDGLFPVFQNTNKPLGYFNRNNVKAGTPYVIIGGSAGQIGICERDYWAADDCAYFDCGDTISNKFLYFLLLFHEREIQSNVRSASVPRLDRKTLVDLFVYFPSLPEQQAIASVLTSMDNELSALEAKRKKYEQIKQGMMQQLLTGRIRLENTSTLLSANTL